MSSPSVPSPSQLNQRHQEDLEARGIPFELAERAGHRSVDAEEMERRMARGLEETHAVLNGHQTGQTTRLPGAKGGQP